jgi:hypothetical protein
MYYVGYSDDVAKRVAEHFLGRGAQWTRLHAPVKVLAVVPGGKELENPTTIALMCQKGWRNVRGGSWCSPVLLAMPLPLARAFAQHPPPELPAIERSGAFDYKGQAIGVQAQGEAYCAKVTGPLAVLACPSTGVKAFVGDSAELARAAAEMWIDGKDHAEQRARGSWRGRRRQRRAMRCL